MRDHWDRWGWVAPLVIVAIVFVRVAWGRESFCGPLSEHCLREWISALGGWVAVGVAIPTVVYLAKQISAADRHHYRATLVELRSARALAKGVRSEAQGLIFMLDLNKFSAGWPSSPAEAWEIVNAVNNALSENFSKFETEVDIPEAGSFSRLKNEMALTMRLLGKESSDFTKFRTYIKSTLDRVEAYAIEVEKMASKFIEDPASFWDRTLHE